MGWSTLPAQLVCECLLSLTDDVGAVTSALAACRAWAALAEGQQQRLFRAVLEQGWHVGSVDFAELDGLPRWRDRLRRLHEARQRLLDPHAACRQAAWQFRFDRSPTALCALGGRVLVGLESGEIWVRSLHADRTLDRWKAHDGAVAHLAIAPTTGVVLSVSGSQLRIWDRPCPAGELWRESQQPSELRWQHVTLPAREIRCRPGVRRCSAYVDLGLLDWPECCVLFSLRTGAVLDTYRYPDTPTRGALLRGVREVECFLAPGRPSRRLLISEDRKFVEPHPAPVRLCHRQTAAALELSLLLASSSPPRKCWVPCTSGGRIVFGTLHHKQRLAPWSTTQLLAHDTRRGLSGTYPIWDAQGKNPHFQDVLWTNRFIIFVVVVDGLFGSSQLVVIDVLSASSARA